MRPSEMTATQFAAYCRRLWANGPLCPVPEPEPAAHEPWAGIQEGEQ